MERGPAVIFTLSHCEVTQFSNLKCLVLRVLCVGSCRKEYI